MSQQNPAPWLGAFRHPAQVSEQLASSLAAQELLGRQVEQAGQQVTGLAQQLEEEQGARALAVRDAADKGAKLAQLEGGPGPAL